MAQHQVPSVDEIVDTFRATDVESRRRLIGRCPPTKFTEHASMVAGAAMTPGTNVQALLFLADSYTFNGPEKFGIAFASACYKLARELYEGPGAVQVHLTCAGLGIVDWMTSLSRIGRHQEARERGLEGLEWLKAKGDTSNIAGVQLRLVEAVFGLQDYDEAERILDAMDESALPMLVAMNYRILRDRLEQHKQHATKVAGEGGSDPRSRLRRMLGVPGTSPGGGETTDSDIEAYTSFSDEILTKVLGGTGGNNEFAIRQRVLHASNLFRDPIAGRDPARIAESERVLLAARDWLRDNNFPDGESDACWALYLCYSRTGRDSLAIEALQRVRTNIETARSRIADPTERAGITARFPLLYPCLVTLLYKLDRPRELLEAIEASKGRALADVLALGGGGVLPDAAFSSAVSELPTLLAKLSKEHVAHYVTYFVDEDCTYSAFVSPRGGGRIHVSKLDISKAALDGLAREIRKAASFARGAAHRIPADLGERLAPLVESLGGSVRRDDHLCYSPDDALHLLPLQAADFQGRPLVETASVSRVHGAHLLRELLRSAPRPRKGCLVVEVPAVEDAGNDARLKVFAKTGDWLRTHVPDAKVMAREKADMDRLRKTQLRDRVVHFATHGVFPPDDAKGSDGNPYRASGLLIAADGKLPSLRASGKGQGGAHLMSPESIVKGGLDLSGSHFTLQACVSGLAREGIGGDALGLEWALFQRGAASILSTHWNVSAQTTGAFASRFYSRLLEERLPRAAAWRNTVLEFLERQDELAQPYHWSAFSLSGDWR